MAEILVICWKRYLKQLDDRPLQTKALTAALLAGTADIIAQRLGSRRSKLNWRRTLSIALYGLIWGGPSNHFWQTTLDGLVPKRRGDALRPAKKVLVDQLTFGPLNNILFMLYLSMVVEGRSWAVTRRQTAINYPNVQANGWKLWPLAQLINQSVVPMKLRVLWTNGVALVWSTFMIMRGRQAKALLPSQKRYGELKLA